VANARTTEQVSSVDTSGSPIGLAYGYVWATGKRLLYTTRQNTGNSNIDFTRMGLWALGEGEWDGAPSCGVMTTMATRPAMRLPLTRHGISSMRFLPAGSSRTNGPGALTAAEAARVDWGSIVESATYFDSMLANGRRRFTGNYCFTSAATLNAILEQMLLTCRSHTHEYAGKIYLICDQPRPSTFLVTRDCLERLEPND
jgi:hypothetical protein